MRTGTLAALTAQLRCQLSALPCPPALQCRAVLPGCCEAPSCNRQHAVSSHARDMAARLSFVQAVVMPAAELLLWGGRNVELMRARWQCMHRGDAANAPQPEQSHDVAAPIEAVESAGRDDVSQSWNLLEQLMSGNGTRQVARPPQRGGRAAGRRADALVEEQEDATDADVRAQMRAARSSGRRLTPRIRYRPRHAQAMCSSWRDLRRRLQRKMYRVC